MAVTVAAHDIAHCQGRAQQAWGQQVRETVIGKATAVRRKVYTSRLCAQDFLLRSPANKADNPAAQQYQTTISSPSTAAHLKICFPSRSVS